MLKRTILMFVVLLAVLGAINASGCGDKAYKIYKATKKMENWLNDNMGGSDKKVCYGQQVPYVAMNIDCHDGTGWNGYCYQYFCKKNTRLAQCELKEDFDDLKKQAKKWGTDTMKLIVIDPFTSDLDTSTIPSSSSSGTTKLPSTTSSGVNKAPTNSGGDLKTTNVNTKTTKTKGGKACFCSDNVVKTSRGYLAMNKLVRGDVIEAENRVRVISVIYRHREGQFEAWNFGGINVTADHLVLKNGIEQQFGTPASICSGKTSVVLSEPIKSDGFDITHFSKEMSNSVWRHFIPLLDMFNVSELSPWIVNTYIQLMETSEAMISAMALSV